jgi:hypothetical protein
MTESVNESQAPAVVPSLVESHALCRRCGYDLHGIPTDGLCPECGESVAASLRGNLLTAADPKWLASLLRGARMLLIGFVLCAVIGVIGAITSDDSPSDDVLAVLSLSGILIICWCAEACLLLSKRDPSGLGEREYGRSRKIARAAMLLGAMQGVVDWMYVFGANRLVRYLPFIAVETMLAEAIGVVGVFAHLDYFQKLTRRMPHRRISGLAGFLKFAIAGAWALLYFGSVLFFLELQRRIMLGSKLESILGLLVVIDLLLGLILGLIYLGFMVGLERFLAGVVREARKNGARPAG